MPRRSSVVLKLPPETRLELDGRIIKDGFGGYQWHCAWLKAQGFDISRSAVQRYGQALSAELPAPLARIRLNSAIRARVRAETSRRSDAFEATESALELAEEGLQEHLHAKLESGESFDREELAHVFVMLVNAARARGTISRAKRRGAEGSGKGRRRGLSPEGEKHLRSIVEGPPE